MMQILAAIVTVLATAWLCTYGAIAAILALMTAKHILVAILVMGLGVNVTCRKMNIESLLDEKTI